MKRYIITAIMAMIFAFAGSAQEVNAYALQVNTKDGTTVNYEFEYNPVVTFDGDNVVIIDDYTGISTTYNMVDIENFTILKPELGVEKIAVPDLVVKVYRECISIAGLAAGASVNIFNLAGSVVASSAAGENGSVTLAIDDLGSGVFVVSMPGNSFKFIR